MKSVVYLELNDINRSSLIDKIIELGYEEDVIHIWGGIEFDIYYVDMDIEDLVILKLAVPLIQIDNYDK